VKVTVLIVNWNGRHLLPRCFDCLRASTVAPHQVILVDNGSEDGSREFLADYAWPELQTLYLDSNRGFSGGNNAGFPLVEGDILALLNTDVEVDPAWLERGLEPFADTTVGMVACKVVRLDHPDRIDKAGHLMYPDGLNRGRGTGQPDDGRFDAPEEVLWPDGCAGFYRVAMLREIGFLDEDFFCYGEDAELGMRARWAGYRCSYQPAALAKHRVSASLGRFSPLKAYYVERNRIWVLCKTFPLGYLLRSPWHTLRRYAMNLFSIVSGQGSAASFNRSHSSGTLALRLLQANWDGLLGIPRMLAKRRHLVRRVPAAEIKRLLKRHRISAREITLQD